MIRCGWLSGHCQCMLCCQPLQRKSWSEVGLCRMHASQILGCPHTSLSSYFTCASSSSGSTGCIGGSMTYMLATGVPVCWFVNPLESLFAICLLHINVQIRSYLPILPALFLQRARNADCASFTCDESMQQIHQHPGSAFMSHSAAVHCSAAQAHLQHHCLFQCETTRNCLVVNIRTTSRLHLLRLPKILACIHIYATALLSMDLQHHMIKAGCCCP